MQRRNLMRRCASSVLALTSLLALSLGGAIMLPGSAFGKSEHDLFEQVGRTVEKRFFDPDLNGVDWQAIREKYKAQAAEAASKAERAAVVNEMLAELKTSHTRLFTADEPAYYQILGVFLASHHELRRRLKAIRPDVTPTYTGIGLFTKEIDGQTFVSGVLDGGPAAEAGLLVGDRLLESGGKPFHPIRSFAGKAGQPVKLTIQRSAKPESRREITVRPQRLDGAEMFVDALNASVRVVEREGRRIGYAHVWSYAGEKYQRALEQALIFGRLKDADALVLDLRQGWGGASPSYLNIFTPRTLSLTVSGRGERPSTFGSGWSKPVVLLVNETTRSGKELLAYGFRKHKIGPVVGTRTAGAVVAGSPFAMDDGSLLYLAVADVHVDGDRRLEGVGVAPDIEVPFTLPYAQGADPQKDRAIAVAVDLAKRG